MAWIYLLIAGAMEIIWAVGLKYSHGFTRLGASVITAICMVLSYVFLALALKGIPLGTGYAAWTGIGVVGTAIYGFLYFGEPFTVARIVCILMIVTGIVGLKLVSA
jgi:quaternary ammonium compound-resistance protein SugE